MHLAGSKERRTAARERDRLVHRPLVHLGLRIEHAGGRVRVGGAKVSLERAFLEGQPDPFDESVSPGGRLPSVNLESSAPGSDGVAREPVRASRRRREMPLRSSLAVGTRRTRESTSSTQATGISSIEKPIFHARNSNSVSKNHPSSSISGTTCSTTVRLTALNPHCASRIGYLSAFRAMKL